MALHASSHPSSLFLLKLGTCTPNKATAHQAACFAVCFHTTELAVPTGCWKRAKENYLACHISSLATASQEEGLKLNGNGNKIQLSDPCCWVSPTTTLPTQAATRPPRQKKTCHEACGSDSRECNWFSVTQKTLFLSLHRRSLWYIRCCTASQISKPEIFFYHQSSAYDI